MHILGSLSYAELLEQTQLKFPTAPPCALKYLDRYHRSHLLDDTAVWHCPVLHRLQEGSRNSKTYAMLSTLACVATFLMTSHRSGMVSSLLGRRMEQKGK